MSAPDVGGRKLRVLFELTGSIACYKACAAISRLAREGFVVQCVATESALRFVGAATLEGLTGRPVATQIFAGSRMMDHIHLARWADLAIVAPATASTINRLSAGLADDLVGALFLAHDFSRPFLVAPAMNPRMLSHPATQASLGRLREWGVRVLSTGSGVVACGDEGEGRLLEPDQLVQEIRAALRPPGPKLRVLVTSGGTQEPIDGVRFITNASTGSTGAVIADHFAARGHEVVYVHATGAVMPSAGWIRALSFRSFGDLDSALRRLLADEKFDLVVHLAAVSDFSVDSIERTDGGGAAPGAGKLDSRAPLTLRLRTNFKILGRLRSYARDKGFRLVAFKLTDTRSEAERSAAVAKVLSCADVDFVVHNDLSEISADGSRHRATIFGKRGVVASCESKRDLAQELEKLGVTL